jgi:enoyl-CoA hydratase
MVNEEITPGLDFSIDDRGVATIWLDRPGLYNCIAWPMLLAMEDLQQRVEYDDKILALVLRGRNGNFCSGFDLNTVQGDFLGRTRAPLEMVTKVAKVYDGFNTLRKPTLALVEGVCTAGGFEAMIGCDFAIATEDARIGDFHIRRAMGGGGGPIYRLPRIVGMRRAKELMFSGKMVSGKKAAQWGLVNESCPPGGLDEAADAFLQPMLEQSPYTMWITKMSVNHGLDADQNTLMTLEHLGTALTMESNDAVEAVGAFLEKRDPVWTAS